MTGLDPSPMKCFFGVTGRAGACSRRKQMFENEWSIRLACENNEGLVLAETADRMTADDMEI